MSTWAPSGRGRVPRRGLTQIDWEKVLQEDLPPLIARALQEDIGSGASPGAGENFRGDVTTLATVPADLQGDGVMVVKAVGIIAGLHVAEAVFTHVDPAVKFKKLVADGDPVAPGDQIAEVYGPVQALLTAERLALNFLQRMSGIATQTHRYAKALAGANTKILDTRKTAPGLRLLDKWAVEMGGGYNHRIGLYDMALIKDNHIAAAGGVTAAVQRVRAMWGDKLPVEVEVKNFDELKEAVDLPVDQIMLDNMGLAEVREAVAFVAGRVPLEASGNVDLETVASIASTGVDYISVGKLTHSVEALDISFLI